MGPTRLAVALLVTVLFPQLGNAQVFQVAGQPPVVTAAHADWQIRGVPVFFAGSFYYPAGPTVFFDPYVMARIGGYDGVPLYADTTLEPYSIVYVPIGGNLMRPYERRRTGELTGTVGSRTPSFPVDHDVDLSATVPTTGLQFPPRGSVETEAEPEEAMPVGTSGSIPPSRVAPPPAGSIEPVRRQPTHVESIPRPRSNDGIWLEFGGTKWHAQGDAVQYAPEKFVSVGDYHGFPVYRERGEQNDRIYIPAVEGGPLTRYQRP